MDAVLCLIGKGIKWFSHRLWAVQGHLYVGLCAEWSVTPWLSWLGHKQVEDCTRCNLFEKSMFSSFHMGFQSRAEMQWDSVWDGIVCLGNVLWWWWGGRKGIVSVPSGWLLRSWCCEETCPVSCFWPSERQGDKAAESIASQQQHTMEISRSVMWLCPCRAWQEPYILFPPSSLTGFLALSK